MHRLVAALLKHTIAKPDQSRIPNTMQLGLSLFVTLLGASSALARSCYCGDPATRGERFYNGRTWAQICCDENGGTYSSNYIPGLVFNRNSCRDTGNEGGYNACCGRLGGGAAVCG
jgi:hypothetical protein